MEGSTATITITQSINKHYIHSLHTLHYRCTLHTITTPCFHAPCPLHPKLLCRRLESLVGTLPALRLLTTLNNQRLQLPSDIPDFMANYVRHNRRLPHKRRRFGHSRNIWPNKRGSNLEMRAVELF